MIKENEESNKKGIFESKEKDIPFEDDKTKKYIDEQDNTIGNGING